MSFRVFLSYSLDPAEQSLAWRLQTLASSYGVEVYVPNRTPSALSSLASRSEIEKSDCVLAIIASKVNLNVQKELNYALEKGKLVIPIVHAEVANNPLLARFPQVFVFSQSDNLGKVETDVLKFLNQQHQSKENRQKIAALVAVGLGLLLLSSLGKK